MRGKPRCSILLLSSVGRVMDTGDLTGRELALGRGTPSYRVTAGPKATREDTKATIQAMGCARYGIWFKGRNLPAGAKRKSIAWYPEDSRMRGRLYTYLDPGDVVHADGTLAEMFWDPWKTPSGWPDPSGVYRMNIYIIEAEGSESTFLVEFLLSYGSSLADRLYWCRRTAVSLSRRLPRHVAGRLVRKLGPLTGRIRRIVSRQG